MEINMNIQQIFNAIPVIQKITNFKLPIKKAYIIYSLSKQINEYKSFFFQEERKLAESCNAEISEDGKLTFKSPEDQVKFIQEHNEMFIQELEDFKAVDLKLDDLGDETLSPQDIMALEGVINFID
jgi:hypothetical protein